MFVHQKMIDGAAVIVLIVLYTLQKSRSNNFQIDHHYYFERKNYSYWNTRHYYPSVQKARNFEVFTQNKFHPFFSMGPIQVITDDAQFFWKYEEHDDHDDWDS